jgi:hypothetical protein
MIASIIATGTCRNRGSMPRRLEQQRALLPRRQRRARAADGQDTVRLLRIDQAGGDEPPQIVVADRLAGRERPVPEQQERLARPHPRDLPRQRLEERRRPHDGPAQARAAQPRLEGQLRALEFQQRLLHADRREQHELPTPAAFAASSATTCASWSMAQASFGAPLREARQDTTASNRPGSDTSAMAAASVTSATSSSARRGRTVARRLGPHDAGHVMPRRHQRPRRALSGGPGAAQQQHAFGAVGGGRGRHRGQLRSGSAVNLA